MLDALGSLDPPPRFAEAHLTAYRADSASQREALRQARAFAVRVARTPSWTERLRGWLPGSSGPQTPRGLYLVGPAGTGKTHLMAAVFHQLAPQTPCAFLHSGTFFRTAARPERLAEALAERGPDGPAVRALLLDEVELDDAANEARLAHFLRALLVRGDDRRRRNGTPRRGAVFVGPPEAARTALRDAYEAANEPKRWLAFAELRRAATETAHARLIDELLTTERLYVAGVRLNGTDDALRLLRLVDDLYTAPDAPALFFSALAPPEDWFTAGGEAAEGLRAGVAEKFKRTVSRLRELCDVKRMDDVRLAKGD
ncbi:MAG: cell division protein ZapE [Bacteroidetes bacterium QH_2_67_10]|nr:MAG: cell division protein ZapE [Bacteroidetes bacterium QH_2_67_10]